MSSIGVGDRVAVIEGGEETFRGEVVGTRTTFGDLTYQIAPDAPELPKRVWIADREGVDRELVPVDAASIEELAQAFGLPEDEVRVFVDELLTQLDVQVSDYLRGDTGLAESVVGLEELIVANALDEAKPRGVDRAEGRLLARQVVGPRLVEIQANPDEFDAGGAVSRVIDDVFPLESGNRNGSVCDYLMENYQDAMTEAMQRTRDTDNEHGFIVAGELGDVPPVEMTVGEEGSILLPEVPDTDPLGIKFHAHHPEREDSKFKIAERAISAHFSPGDMIAFVGEMVHVDEVPQPPALRGSVIGFWDVGGRDEYKIRGIQVTPKLLQASQDKRKEVGIALAAAIDDDFDDPRVPEWVPADASGNMFERMEQVGGDYFMMCERNVGTA